MPGIRELFLGRRLALCSVGLTLDYGPGKQVCRGSQGPLLAAFGANYVDYKAFKNVYIYMCVYIYIKFTWPHCATCGILVP